MSMTRYDPARAERANNSKTQATRTSDTNKSSDKTNKKERNELANVSKDTFYKIKGNFQQSLQGEDSFSLLRMFGETREQGGLKSRSLQQFVEST